MDLITLVEHLGMDLGDPPTLVEDRCLNHRVRQRECTICQDVCPVQAIAVEVGDPQRGVRPSVSLDEEACARCGLCLHACPVGAYTHPAREEQVRAFVRAAASLADRPLELVCPVQKEVPTNAPVEARLYTGRCLASLSLAELLDVARLREQDVWLDDRGCATCPLAAAHDDIQRVVTQANRLLAAWGRPARVRTHTGDGRFLPDRPMSVPLYDVWQPALSRRELFGMLGELAARAVITVAAEVLVPPAPDPSTLPPDQRLFYHYPEHRRHLKAALKRLGQPAEETLDLEGLPWTVVQVNDACSACGLCARFCPTAALRFYSTFDTEGEEGRYALTFVPPDCVDCGICKHICPEDALSYVNVIYTDWLVSDEQALLREGRLVPCEMCGRATADRNPALCYDCAPKQAWQERWKRSF